MLTINYKGKTYKPTDAWHFSVQAIVNDLIEKDCLEEVKENKETIDMDKQNEWIPFEIRHQDSILEKLMEALIKQQENVIGELSQDIDEMSRRCWEWVSSGIEFAIQKLLLLTSLETKEEPEEFSDAVKFEIERWCMPCTWNLPPEEATKRIKDWEKEVNSKPQFTPWQEDKIEPELPDFDFWKIRNSADVWIDKIWLQVEALTKAYQALSRQKPTK